MIYKTYLNKANQLTKVILQILQNDVFGSYVLLFIDLFYCVTSGNKP